MRKRTRIVFNERRGRVTVGAELQEGLEFAAEGEDALLVVSMKESDDRNYSVHLIVPAPDAEGGGSGDFRFDGNLPLISLLKLCDIDLLSYAESGSMEEMDDGLASAYILGLEDALNTVGELHIFKDEGRLYATLDVGNSRIICELGQEGWKYFKRSKGTR